MKPGCSKPHTHSNPTNLALFRHKITLYRFNQGGGSYYCRGGGSNGSRGAEPLEPSLTLTTAVTVIICFVGLIVYKSISFAEVSIQIINRLQPPVPLWAAFTSLGFMDSFNVNTFLHPSRSYYLRQGGYVFIGISLFVSRITQKPLNRFSQKSLERWQMAQGRSC